MPLRWSFRTSRLCLMTWVFAVPPVSSCAIHQETSVAASATRTSQAQPDSEGVYRVTDGVSSPKLVYSVEPEFSEAARKKRIGGNCRVSLIVTVDGRVRDVRVVHSIADDQPPKLRQVALSLDAKALEAVRQYRFEPGLLEGRPVPVSLTVEVNFQSSKSREDLPGTLVLARAHSSVEGPAYQHAPATNPIPKTCQAPHSPKIAQTPAMTHLFTQKKVGIMPHANPYTGCREYSPRLAAFRGILSRLFRGI